MPDPAVFSSSRHLATALGEPSVAAWARKRGFTRSAVLMAIRRWGHRPNVRPHGGVSRQIMSALRHDLDAARSKSGNQALLA